MVPHAHDLIGFLQLGHAQLDFGIAGVLPLLAQEGASGVPNLARAAGRLHPLVVHFPIALALVAVGMEWWRSLSRRSGMSPLTVPLLLIAAASAIASSATGWVNASFEYGGDDAPALALHRWIGTGTSVGLALLAWWGFTLSAEIARGASTTAASAASLGTFRWASLFAGIAVSVTGHLGGNLVHGEGYLTEVLFPPAAKPVEDAKESTAAEVASLTADETFFLQEVRPLLEAHCFECHGARKQKGGLRMDSKSWLFNGEESDWTVLPGKAAESLLVHRIELDRADPDAMPPEGDGLKPEEIAKLRKWIDAGAAYPNLQPAAVGAGGLPTAATSAALAASGTVALAGGSTVTISPAVRAKAEAAAKTLAARGVLVQPLAAESPLLDVNASRANPPIGDADAALLAEIAPVVANLNLAKSAMTDAGLAKIGAMPHLERLRLDGTAAGDSGVGALGTLPRLESVNLVGSKITPATAKWLRAQPVLRRAYVWQTGLDAPEAIRAATEGTKLELIGADLPLAKPTTPPMPEEPAKDTAVADPAK
jgi:mono/diheme cytochrome c family protein/uncharacterized membrane protein